MWQSFLNLITTFAAVAALYFAWQSVKVGNQSIKLTRMARREEARYRAQEHRAREQERLEEERYRAALRAERERERQLEAEARRHEHLTRIAQLVAEVRDAGRRVAQGQPAYLLDTAQWKLRAALVEYSELERCRDLAYLRADPRGTITADAAARCVVQSEAALEEVGRLLLPAYRVESEGLPYGRPGAGTAPRA